jgi:putative acyl-CoA dehydrogenase
VSAFYQDGPVLGNQYAEDPLLRTLLQRRLPAAVFTEIDAGLTALGQRAATDIAAAGEAAEASPPRLIPYDPWGRRIDRIETSPAWRTLECIAATEGIVATHLISRDPETFWSSGQWMTEWLVASDSWLVAGGWGG